MSARLDAFLDAAARIPGVRIIEHPRYGGVTPAAHVVGSQHPKGNAADINVGPPRLGAPADEVAILLQLAQAAWEAGLNPIYTPWRRHPKATTAAAHINHLHVDGLTCQAFPNPRPNPDRARAILNALTPTTPPPAPPASPTQEVPTVFIAQAPDGRAVLVTGSRVIGIVSPADLAAHTTAGVRTAHVSQAQWDRYVSGQEVVL